MLHRRTSCHSNQIGFSATRASGECHCETFKFTRSFTKTIPHFIGESQHLITFLHLHFQSKKGELKNSLLFLYMG